MRELAPEEEIGGDVEVIGEPSGSPILSALTARTALMASGSGVQTLSLSAIQVASFMPCSSATT